MKRLEAIRDRGRRRTTVAVFRMVDGRLEAEWHGDAYRVRFERHGIAGPERRALYPADGRAFYDALDEAYRDSPHMAVVTADDTVARMDPAGLDALLEAIAHMHEVAATWLEPVPVHETFKGETVWQGDVQVFAIDDDHPSGATRVYAWSHAVGETGRRKFYAILGAGPVVDAVSAVRVAIASGS